jgi:peptidoglycan/xylan/chitin deacetylase (PgdA/CDA1 family)
MDMCQALPIRKLRTATGEPGTRSFAVKGRAAMTNDSHGVSRRTVLRWGVGATALGTTAAVGGFGRPGPARARAAAPPVLAVRRLDPRTERSTRTPHTSPARAAHTGPATASAGSVPAWAQRWPAAIRSIDDFRRRCPRPIYPANAIMLTVDDGPSPVWTPRYLRLFARHGIVATFCMIGAQVPANRALVKAVADHGHTIANHTWTHDLDLGTRDPARIRGEIHETSGAIYEASGFVVRQFRAPGGNWTPAIFDELVPLRMMPLGWDVDPRDWSLPGTASIERAVLSVRRHGIVLCHDGGGDRSETYAALAYAIPRLKDAGYRFVTLPSPR